MTAAERKGFDLGDYVEVKDRIRIFYELFGQGRLETNYTLTNEPDDKPKVICRALAYRTPDDTHPAVGHSWMYLPGTTPYTRGSEIENAETSAVGRAIGMLGILIDKSIATQNEIDNKAGGRPAEVLAEVAQASPFQSTETGVVEFAKKLPADGELRSGPSGSFLVFRFLGDDGKAILPQVAAYGPLAEALSTLRRTADFLSGTKATISGVIDRVPFGDSNRTFQRMTLSRLEKLGPDGWVIPAPELVPDLPNEDAAELESLEVPWPDIIETTSGA